MGVIRIGLAQINCVVGDLTGNLDKIRDYVRRGADAGVELLALPELAICGYPPEDLLFKPQFVDDVKAGLEELARFTREFSQVTVVVGCLDRRDRRLYNGAAVINSGSVLSIYHKHHLPNYGVFDEKRYFTSGRDYVVLEVSGVLVGVSICEDIWYKTGPPGTEVSEGGAELVVNLNASPYHVGKPDDRKKVLRAWAHDHRAAVAYVNMVGGQDELVFDGQSLVIDADGHMVAMADQFVEDLLIVDIDSGDIQAAREKHQRSAREADAGTHEPAAGEGHREVTKLTISDRSARAAPEVLPQLRAELPQLSEVWQALSLGVSDYVIKNGFSHVLLGLSGGVDSALTAAIATDALGSDKVTTVFLPSRYTSTASLEDAAALAENLGIEMITIPIEPMFRSYLAQLRDVFSEYEPDVTEENLQARIRGDLLMALSNKFDWLLLSTGNKSEMSVGYATLYGDMSGGYSILKDIFKTSVYELARDFNERQSRQLIPQRILTRSPSAELNDDQKDSDTLPEYSVLDPILRLYVEEEQTATQIRAAGFGADTVERVISLVDRSEYKRRQAPPGVKITPRAFGKDWRVPITNKYQARD